MNNHYEDQRLTSLRKSGVNNVGPQDSLKVKGKVARLVDLIHPNALLCSINAFVYTMMILWAAGAKVKEKDKLKGNRVRRLQSSTQKGTPPENSLQRLCGTLMNILWIWFEAAGENDRSIVIMYFNWNDCKFPMEFPPLSFLFSFMAQPFHTILTIPISIISNFKTG